MLFRSKDNLWSGSLEFLENSENITLYSAYIRTEQLKKLNVSQKIRSIIVRWDVRDIHQGASDLELFDYCIENDIALFRNTQIHLKCLRNEKNDVFFGSANITSRGIGSANDKFNFELNGLSTNISFQDILYLDGIISGSTFVTQELYDEIKESLDELTDFTNQELEYQKIKSEKFKGQQDYFLISELPMFMDIQNMYSAIQEAESLSLIEQNCLSHDISTYDLDLNQGQEAFYSDLKSKFNAHPFVQALKSEVKNDNRKSLGYGRVVDWIKNNTTTVPTPISWELKERQVVNILYNWICFFDEEFTVSRPGYSEVLFYNNR